MYLYPCFWIIFIAPVETLSVPLSNFLESLGKDIFMKGIGEFSLLQLKRKYFFQFMLITFAKDIVIDLYFASGDMTSMRPVLVS